MLLLEYRHQFNNITTCLLCLVGDDIRPLSDVEVENVTAIAAHVSYVNGGCLFASIFRLTSM